MNTARRAAVAVMLLMSLSACEKKAKTAPPPQAQAPILPPSKMVYIPDFPGLPPPPLRDVVVASAEPENPEPTRPHRTPRRKPSPAKPAAAADTASQTTEKATPPPQNQASTGTASEVSPIGQLSSSGEDGNSQGRPDVEKLITDTENGLNGIKRTLSSDEQLTSTQIKTFLTKARQALAENDLDGAQTLANKAK